MKLLFTGDINFRGLKEPTPETCADTLAEVLPYFNKADFKIANLEPLLPTNQALSYQNFVKLNEAIQNDIIARTEQK